MTKKLHFQGQNFRWVVPQLPAEIWNKKDQFKTDLLDKLLASKTAKKGIKYYSIAIESHADGNPHLDMLLIFEKKIRLANTELDFLCQKHGDLTRYRNLNQAILDYSSKEDTPLSNCPDVRRLLDQQEIKKDPYRFFQRQMQTDPFGFDLARYCAKNDYFASIQRWSYIKNKLKDHQEAVCNLELLRKPGILEITPALIEQELTQLELDEFHSWLGYQTIVDYINQIREYRSFRPFKSKQLILVGEPNIGKTSLINKLQELLAVYPMGVSNWFPRYSSGIYQIISWNEFRLSLMPYTQLLQFLEGSMMDLQFKGGSVLKKDNPLIIMTSNLRLSSHLFQKFKNDTELLVIASQNLSVRIQEILIPFGKNLFFLQKLIIKADKL